MPGRIVRRTGDLPARSLWTRVKDVALTDVAAIARAGAIEGSLEKLEEVLLEADFGVPTTMRLVAEIEAEARRGSIKTQEQFLGALRAAIESSLRSGNSDPRIIQAKEVPTVILVVGVNGAGKTTFIGKFSDLLKHNKMSALVGAADTFRAGAIDQLRTHPMLQGLDATAERRLRQIANLRRTREVAHPTKHESQRVADRQHRGRAGAGR